MNDYTQNSQVSSSNKANIDWVDENVNFSDNSSTPLYSMRNGIGNIFKDFKNQCQCIVSSMYERASMKTYSKYFPSLTLNQSNVLEDEENVVSFDESEMKEMQVGTYHFSQKNDRKLDFRATFTAILFFLVTLASLAYFSFSVSATPTAPPSRHQDNFTVRPESDLSAFYHHVEADPFDESQQSMPTKEENPITPKTIVEENAAPTEWPKVAWLLSFPQSGATFILDTVMKVSNMTVATNNAPLDANLLDNEGYSITPNSNYTSPFLENKMKVPSRYILTNTYCGYDFMRSYYSFQQSCSTGSRIYPSKKKSKSQKETCKNGHCREEIKFDIDNVKKAVHLIRNPFDNIISRFNHEYKANITYVKWLKEHPGEYHDKFHSWCERMDRKLSENEIRYYGLEFPEEVPCHSEFFKYVQWHNNAFTLSFEMDIPTLIIHYEDYKNDMERTVTKITSFLELEIVADPFKFSSHDYKFIFSEKQRKAIIDWIMELASKSTKENLGRYFYYDSWPKIAWLMSYPASGTTFTLDVVKKVSNRTVAFNHGHHYTKYSRQVHHTYTSGPFLDTKNTSLLIPDKYVLTKTHCHHSQKLASSKYMFLKDCLGGVRFYPIDDKSKTPDSAGCKDNWCEEEVTYDIKMVKKIVHNIRNPFNNVIARFNNPQKRNATHMNWLHEHHNEYRDAFHTWCEEKDSKLTENDLAYYGKDFPANVPCTSEFFRYFQWHNYAFELTAELEIPTLVLHYENYEDIDNAVNGLIDFLEVDPVASPLPFSPHSYSFMYSNDDRKAIADWAKELSSKETWKHLETYFVDI